MSDTATQAPLVSDCVPASREEKLMYISQLLSSYPDVFSGATNCSDNNCDAADPPIPGPVTRELVERAVEYRKLLINIMDLQGLLGNPVLSDLMTEEEREKATTTLASLRSRKKHIEANPNVRLAQRMLCRLEVWGTKGTAQTLLTHRTSKGFACCPLLNLPVASHFHKLLPAVMHNKLVPTGTCQSSNSEQQRCPELPLPPNALTWKEYHRLCNILRPFATPEQRKEVALSATAATSPSLVGKSSNGSRIDLNNKLNVNATYTLADLAALWVRAQRNTGALLHMIQLFQISKKANKREAVHDANDSKHAPNCATYLAEYVGNCSRVKKIVQSESTKVDLLVEWAVANQVLHTQATVEQAVDGGLLPPVTVSSAHSEGAAFVSMGHGRPSLWVGVSSSTEHHQLSRKRVHDEDSLESNKKRRKSYEEVDVLFAKAVHSYFIRWLARKHQQIASLLLSPRTPDRGEGRELVEKFSKLELLRSRLQTEIGNLMGLGGTVANECCLDLLDQKPGEEVVDIVAELDHIDKLLQSLEAVVGRMGVVEGLTQKDIGGARNDIKELQNSVVYSAETGERLCLRSIAEGLVDVSGGELSDVLLLESLDIPAPWVTKCPDCSEPASDARAVVRCALCEKVFHEEGHGSVMSSVRPIKVVKNHARLKKLFKVRLPSNIASPDFTVENSDVKWTPMQFEVDSPRVGATIQHVGVCKGLYEKLCNHNDLEVLEKIIPGTVEPCVLPDEGLLIVKIFPGGMGERIGLKSGDVVIAVMVRETKEYVDYRDKKRRAMVELLQKASMIYVRRPSKDIVGMIRSWKEAVVDSNRVLCDDIWVCKSCQGKVPDDFSGLAKRCRTVIRRLSFDPFSRPSLSEMMRLDDMMTTLISSDPMNLKTIDSAAFFRPPQPGDQDARQPIEWASGDIRKEPGDLLCEGMFRLLKKSEAGTEVERDAFLTKLLHLFVVSCTPTTGDKNKLSSIPLWAENARKFDLPQLCQSCYIRADVGATNCPTCGSKLLSERDYNAGEVTDASSDVMDITVDFAPKDQEAKVELSRFQASLAYRANSSLVGAVFLALPRDPLVVTVGTALPENFGTTLTSADRPIIFVVTSYVPSRYRSGMVERASLFSEGVFDVVPVIEESQLNYLLQLTTTTRVVPTSTEVSLSNPQWMETKLDELVGVAHLSSAELRRRLQETDAIMRSIDGAIHSMVATATPQAQRRERDDQAFPIRLPLFRWGGSCDLDWSPCECDDRFTLVEYRDLRFDGSTTISSDFGLTCRVIDALDDGNPKFFTSLVRPRCRREEANRDATACAGEGPEHGLVSNGAAEEIEQEEDTTTQTRQPEQRSSGTIEPEDKESEMPQQTPERHVLFADLTDGAHSTKTPPCRQRTDRDDYQTVIVTKYEPYSDGDDTSMACWGLEIVSWAHEPDCIRVGKVEPESPAFEAGLQEHDIIEAINEDLVSNNTAAFFKQCFQQGHDMLVIVVQRDPRVRPAPELERDSQNGRTVNLNDIYKESLPWTELTIVQTAVIKMALSKNLPGLARRLLCPSLPWDEALIVCSRLQRRMADLQTVACIPEDLWNRIVRLDNERSLSEEGRVECREAGNEYKVPTARLPLDAIAENFLIGSLARNPPSSSASPVDVANHPSNQINGDGDDASISIEGSRIRGGGNRGPKLGLRALSRSRWKLQAVYGNAAFGDELSKFVGFIHEDANICDTHNTKVSVIWVKDLDFENTGPLLPVSYDIDAEIADLFLVLTSSTESAIGEEFLAGQDDAHPRIQYFDPSQLNLLAETAWEEQARKLILRHSERAAGQITLGHLPDGRSLFWVVSDPGSLFVGPLDKQKLTGADEPVANASGCPWRCGCHYTNLSDHLQDAHFYSDKDVVFDGIHRISTKQQIAKLMVHLSEKLVADCPILATYLEEGLVNDHGGHSEQEPVGRVLSAAQVFEFDRDQNLRLKPTIDKAVRKKDLLLLFEQFLLLFKADGSSRLCRFSFRNDSDMTCGEESKHRASPAQCACFGELCTKTARSFDCDLCSVAVEGTLQCAGNSCDKDYRSLGCETLGAASELLVTNETHARMPSTLERIKSLMLELAQSIPSDLRLTTHAGTMNGSRFMWEEKEYQAWCYFVEQAFDLHQLAQALIVLTSSLNKPKLPNWWRASHGGWSQALTLTQLKSLSALALHLYVLDAAIAQADATKKMAQSKGAGDAVSRLKELVDKAVAAGVPVHCGEHSTSCFHCQKEGGNLRCQFCSHSQHGSCCDPPVVEPAVIASWVCNSCATDIAELV